MDQSWSQDEFRSFWSSRNLWKLQSQGYQSKKLRNYYAFRIFTMRIVIRQIIDFEYNYSIKITSILNPRNILNIDNYVVEYLYVWIYISHYTWYIALWITGSATVKLQMILVQHVWLFDDSTEILFWCKSQSIIKQLQINSIMNANYLLITLTQEEKKYQER